MLVRQSPIFLVPSKGVKLSALLLSMICLWLWPRIDSCAPIPGKSLVGIEVPNFKAALATLKELLKAANFRT